METCGTNFGLFEAFCEMLDSLPIKAVVRAADAERKMVEEDLQKKRTEPDEYVNSVLNFCEFLASAVRGMHASIPVFPAEHCVFYLKIVERLVKAGELPAEIAVEYERTFYGALSEQATSDECAVGNPT